ncbi:hypothetical protein BCR35DRAFT_350384 [Leucosporidium creatinivorum]|uniref:Proteophosphoglycan ppg4 n=1 Tax=Leucosporidium creatinivorum TaxID=106004 RepID=A0A1Y2G0K1_9BASI|nr:hypothetical protein BCR35DRAFT_350384 [Leucosporidium creatinivorum]
MQRLARPPSPALPPSQQQLTTSALQLFTERFPASPRKTVQRYLNEQRAHAGSYPPAVTDTLSPGPASPPRTSRVKRRLSSDDHAETALVLHSDDAQDGPGWLSGKKASRPSKEGEGGASSSATRKKPSLVAAMKPKMTSLVEGSPLATTSQERVGTKSRSKSKSKENRARPVDEDDSGSSPLLVARADAREQERRQKKEGELGPRRQASSEAGKKENVAAKGGSTERKGKGKAQEWELVIEQPSKKTKKQKSLLDEDEDEVADRLRARKERRRAKAVIVKDRTQPAKAVGAAAASKVKSSSRKSKRQRGSDDGKDGSSEVEQPAPESRKKKRKASNADLNKELQDGHKAKNVGTSRLTLKVPTKLGLFHNGAASVKTKVGKRLPDLAFSEVNFLNAPRPSPPAPSHFSSSSSASAAPQRSSKPRAHPTVKTYGSRAKKHRSSKYFEVAPQSDPSSDLPAPTPARKSKSRKESSKAEASIRSRPLPPSPPRAPTPKKSKSKSKSRRSPPPSSPHPTTDSSDLHSAHSREQRRSRSAHQQAADKKQDDAQELEEAVLDTSTFWKRGRPEQHHEKQEAREVVQNRSDSPAVDDIRRASPAAAAPAPSLPLDFYPNYALLSPRSSASIDRLLQACETGVYPPAVSLPPRPRHPESIIHDSGSHVSSALDMNAFQPAAGRASRGEESSLRFSSLAGSSTEEVRREVARGVVMGEDGVFRLADSSLGRGEDLSSVGAGVESEGGGRSSMLGAGPEVGGGGSAWMEMPMEGRSLDPTTEGDEDDLHFDQLHSIADDDSMPPPPLPPSRSLDLFSHRQQYQPEPDFALGFGGAGAFGGGGSSRGGGALAEDEAFRSAMSAHWYKSKC